MKVQEHLGKISWTIADKIAVVIFGFISFVLMSMMQTSDYGVWGVLASINLWVFQISTSFGLSGMIQFGVDKSNRPQVDFLSLILHSSIALSVAFIVFILRYPLAEITNEPLIVDVGYYLIILNIVNIPRYYVLKYLQRDYRFKEYFFVNFSYFASTSLLIFYYKFTINHCDFQDATLIFTLGSAISSIHGILLIIRTIELKIHGNIKKRDFIKFTIPVTINGLLYATPRQLDVSIAQLFFSSSVVGIYYSAKQLFRVFEEAGYAAGAMIYPAAIRLITKKQDDEMQKMVIKASSFMFVSFLITVIILNLGLTELIITSFLPERYFSAIIPFNILSIGALFLPFSIMNTYIIAEGKPTKASLYVLYSVIAFSATMFIVGQNGNYIFLPLGLIIFQIILGVLCFFYIRNRYGYPFLKIFQAIPDTYKFLRKKSS